MSKRLLVKDRKRLLDLAFTAIETSHKFMLNGHDKPWMKDCSHKDCMLIHRAIYLHNKENPTKT